MLLMEGNVHIASIIFSDLLHYSLLSFRIFFYNSFNFLWNRCKFTCDELLLDKEKVNKFILSKLDLNGQSLISVIIPTFNEGGNVLRAINSALTDENVEIIISDGGSTDDTLSLCNFSERIKIVNGKSGRGNCLNYGTNCCAGDIVVYLHADSILPLKYGDDIRSALKERDIVAGAFELQLDINNFGLDFISYMANIRSKYFQLPFGDQAIFMYRDIMITCMNGFPEVPIMEDYDLMKKMRKLGKIKILPSKVISSSRRWLMHGIFWNTLLNQIVIFGREVGVPHERLVIWYYGLTSKKNY